MSQSLQNALHDRIVIFDGAMGTEIYRRNFFVNISFENLCLARPDVIRAIHTAYLDAGAEVLTTNSYGANRAKLMKFGLAEQTAAINEAAVKLAREVAGDDAMVAYDRFQHRIGHVHLKDRVAPDDMHCVPAGSGCIPVADLVGKLVNSGYGGWLTVEQYGSRQMLADSKAAYANVTAILQGK